MSNYATFYILDGKTPVVEKDIMKVEEFLKNSNRVVAKTTVNEVEVSTVFLCIDHNFFNDEGPILFETMIFGGKEDGYIQRYQTWEEAENGHKQVVSMINKG